MRAAIYTRISVDRDGDSASPQRQEDAARARCTELEWTVVDVYSDQNVSAYKSSARRPAYERMLADVRHGKIDAVIVWKIDRLSRSMVDFLRTIETLENYGCTLASIRDSVDTSTATGKAMLQMVGVMAELEAATTAERVAAANLARARAGRPHTGGYRSFGYQKSGEMVPAEVEALRAAAQSLRSGATLWEVASRLNADGMLTTAGNEWTTNSLSQSLRSPKLRGVRIHHGTNYPGDWEPVFSEAEHLELLSLLSSGWSPSSRRRKFNHLLTGLLRCGKCHTPVRWNGGIQHGGKYKYPRYQCVKEPGLSGCGGTSVGERSADEFVVGILIAHLKESKDRVTVDGRQDGTSDLEHLLRDDEIALGDLDRKRFLDRSISDDQYSLINAQLTQRIDLTRRRLASVNRRSEIDVPADFEPWWDAASIEERRTALRIFVASIELRPVGRGVRVPVAERLTIEWSLED